jgi:hypothetical protein
MNDLNKKYPCPCCGHLAFDKEPGSSFLICNNCFWQDDCISLQYTDIACGPNKVSLIEAQQNFIKYGATETRLKEAAIQARKTITVNIEQGWRPINLEHDKFVAYDSPDYPEDLTTLYYWRENYWLSY